MGAASVPVRRLAFGVAWWCAVVASCSTPPEAPSTSAGESRNDDAGGAGAGSELFADGAGAPSAKRDPVMAAGAGGADEPTANNGGAGSGMAGAPGVAPDPSGGQAGAEGSDPSCGKQSDGTLCGSNMTPPGPEAARYFCSSGAIIAEAACPGPCDAETNACVQSGGTGEGMGETGFGTLLQCRTCYAVPCRVELMACDADPMCNAHRECYETCSEEHDCYATCDSVFGSEPLLDELNDCVGMTGCVDVCPHD